MFRGSYLLGDAAFVMGTTRRTLDQRIRLSGIAAPSISAASGTGSERRFSHVDIFVGRALRHFWEAGVAVDGLRAIESRLRERFVDVRLRETVKDFEDEAEDGRLPFVVTDGRGIVHLLQPNDLSHLWLMPKHGPLSLVLDLEMVRSECEIALGEIAARKKGNP